MINISIEGLEASISDTRDGMLLLADERAKRIATSVASNCNYEVSIAQQEKDMLIQRHDDDKMSIYNPEHALLTESESLLSNLADVFYFEVQKGRRSRVQCSDAFA